MARYEFLCEQIGLNILQSASIAAYCVVAGIVKPGVHIRNFLKYLYPQSSYVCMHLPPRVLVTRCDVIWTHMID